jgi:AhpD family alkylhydroperoxidase
MDDRVKALISVGASVASNCQPCLTYHIGRAKESGADEKDVAIAIEVAKAVRAGAANSMDKFAETAAGGAGSSPECSRCAC